MRLSKIKMSLAGAVALALEASAVTYLKPLADGESRLTDGRSWATAYADASEAIAAAQAGDGTLHAASGVYRVSEQIKLSKSLSIVGGFAGEDGETPESRSSEAPPTVFTGDREGNDVWAHVTFDTETCKVSEKALENAPIVVGGRIAPPAAYVGDYDIYCLYLSKNRTSDNTPACFEITEKTAALSLDGVTFAGFVSEGLNGNVINCKSGHAAALALTNCQFLANASFEGSVCTEGKTALSLCRTRFAYVRASRNAGVNIKGLAEIVDGSFESIYSGGGLRANALFFHAGSSAMTVERTSFVRLGKASSFVNAGYGGPAVVAGGEMASSRKVFRDCVVSNCFGIVTGGNPEGSIPIVSPNFCVWEFEGCRFSGNWAASRTVSGRSYTLFGVQAGRASGKALWRNCVFDANVCVSTATSAGSGGSYALGICGSEAKGADQVYLNCVFDRNRVEARAPASGVTVVRSQGVLASATVGAVRTSVANSTFRSLGADGVVDVAQYGDQHAAPVNVVNCLFMSDADVATPFHAPSGAASGNGLCVYGSTAQNVLSAPEAVVDGGGWRFDAVPFETGADGIPVPAVRTPGLRESADVVEVPSAATDNLPEFRFRPAGAAADGWLPLNGDALTVAEAVAVADIVGDARPDGASTRGAKQCLTDAAEQGKALVLRRTPLKGGSLDGPSAQSVATGAAAVPVTARTADGATFQGWFREDGTRYSEDATLAAGALDADLVLTAKFLTRAVNLTFDLGDGGTFVANGLSRIVVTAHAGEPFPGLPAYAASPDWIVTGFGGAFPEYVPEEDATYRAELLTTAVRVFRVVPANEVPADSDRSGSSWENATDDIAAAMAEAARHRGELWLKEGVYAVTDAFDIRSNVGLYGGFVGTETSRNEADPVLHVTRLTGDRESGADTEVAFWSDAVGLSTNSVFSGLVFASFAKHAIRFDPAALRSTCRIENCTFEDCGLGPSQSATVLSYGTVDIRGCRFARCRSGLVIGWGWLDSAVGDASQVADCLFEDCEANTVPIVLLANSERGATVTNCTFRRNRAIGTRALLSLAMAAQPVRFADCRFESNANDAAGSSLSALIEVSQNSVFERCRFLGNTNTTAATSGLVAGLFTLETYQACPQIRDCFFGANAVRAADPASGATCASVAAARQGNFLFVNCTFKGNVAEAGSAGVAATAAAGAHHYTSLAFVHVTLADSVLTGGTCAELFQEPGSPENLRTSALSVFNGILFNSASGYRPLLPRAGAPLLVSGSHLSNVRADDLDLTDAASVFRRVSTDDPRLKPKVSASAAGVWAWGVGWDTPLRRTGEKVWLADGAAWFHDVTSEAARPWRSVLNPTARRASVEGLTAESPLPPDAFGAPRARPDAGPLAMPKFGLGVIIR